MTTSDAIIHLDPRPRRDDGASMYTQSITFAFADDVPHAMRLALLANLAARNPDYFSYRIDYGYDGHTCRVSAMRPDVWADVEPIIENARRDGLLRVLSPASSGGKA